MREEHCKQISLVCVGSAPSVWTALGLLQLTAHMLSQSTLLRLQVAVQGNCPKQALGCMHLPGLSHSGSGFRVLHKGTDSVGPAFCALPRSEKFRQERQDTYLSFNNEVFGERGCCNLSPPRRSVIWVYNWSTFSGGC